MAGCTLFTQAGYNLISRDGLHPAAFQVVIAAVEYVARLHQLVEISGQCILQKLIGPASALLCEVVELLFNVGGEVHFHRLQSTEKPRLWQVARPGAALKPPLLERGVIVVEKISK